jgi:hypothetical protein
MHASVSKRCAVSFGQLQVLEMVRPKPMKKLSRETHELTQILGEDHDLAVLGQTLESDRSLHASQAARWLAPVIDARRDELRQQAFELGRRLYRRKPKATPRIYRRFSGRHVIRFGPGTPVGTLAGVIHSGPLP